MRKEIKFTRIKVINKIITINYEETSEGVLCNDSVTAIYIWGSGIGITDLKWKLIERPDNKYLITWDLLNKRKKLLEKRISVSSSALETINDVLKNRGKNGSKKTSD